MYKKLLAPLDGSGLSECSLQHVKAIATGCQVPDVLLLGIIEPLSTQMAYALGEAGGDLITRTEKINETVTKNYIDKAVAKLKQEGIPAKAVILKGQSADKILEYATNNQVDLIIMSTHGRSGVSRWMFGSVAEKVMRSSTVPVLMISPPGCRISAAA